MEKPRTVELLIPVVLLLKIVAFKSGTALVSYLLVDISEVGDRIT